MKVEDFINKEKVVDLSFFNFENAITAAYYANENLEIQKTNKNFSKFFPILGNVTNAYFPNVLEQLGIPEEQIAQFKSQIDENIKVKEFTVLDARSKNRFLGLEPEPRPGIKSGSIEGSKSMPLSEIVNIKDNTFLDRKKLRDIFNSIEISSNKIVMSCGSSVSAASLALAYSLINDDYMPKIYIGSWTEFGKK